MVYQLWRNPLEIWSRAHFEQPVLVGKTIMGVRAVVNDPAAVKRVFLENAANYRKDALQLRVLRPGLRRSPDPALPSARSTDRRACGRGRDRGGRAARR